MTSFYRYRLILVDIGNGEMFRLLVHLTVGPLKERPKTLLMTDKPLYLFFYLFTRNLSLDNRPTLIISYQSS